MRADACIETELLKNENLFQDPFYQRFQLRPRDEALELTPEIKKNYLFPTFYGNVTCALAIFLCDYQKAQALMPHPEIKPVRMPKGRSIVTFSSYEYKNVLNIKPYNEIAMTIPVLIKPSLNIPVLPMIYDKLKNFGYYVFSMPVTSEENRIRGKKIWGLPKVLQDIDIQHNENYCSTDAYDEHGEKYLSLKVPKNGKTQNFDVSANLYSVLNKKLLQSETNFKAQFQVNKYMNLLFKKNVTPKEAYLKIGSGTCAEQLKNLEIEEHPFQFRYAENMCACFDLPNPKYKSLLHF